MVEGRQREEWNHTSHILATLINANRGKNSKAVSPAQCNPFLAAEAKSQRPKMKDVKMLARMMGIPVPEKAGE